MESQKWHIFRISGLSSLPASPQEQRYKSPQSPADQTPSHSLCGAGPAATPGAALLPTAWFPVEPEWGTGQVGTRPASSLRGLVGGGIQAKRPSDSQSSPRSVQHGAPRGIVTSVLCSGKCYKCQLFSTSTLPSGCPGPALGLFLMPLRCPASRTSPP